MKLTNLKPRIGTAPGRLKVTKPDSWRNDKQTSGERGYTYKWQQARKGWLAKYPLCVFCEAKGLTVLASVVDHKVPHRGDMELFWDTGNWQAMAKQCHDKKTATEDGGFGNAAGRTRTHAE